MKKTILLVAGTALMFAGCSRISNKLNRMFGSATPTPVPTAVPVATATPTPSAMPKATATPKPTPTLKVVPVKAGMSK